MKYLWTNRFRGGILLLSLFLLGQVYAQTVPVEKEGTPSLSPEEECFLLLQRELKKNAVFSNLDLTRVQKIDGPPGEEMRSKPFSVATYKDFLKAFNTPVPRVAKDLKYYPDEIKGNVSSRYLDYLEPIKANRTILWAVKYYDGKWTPIGDVDNDGIEEKIAGYFVDVKYVTFGRETDFIYSYPSRDPNPEPDKDWPSGAPFKDMREYIIYTQHLAPQFGGDFLSCGIIKLTPEEGFVLKSYSPKERSIRFERIQSIDPNRADDRIVDIPDLNNKKGRFSIGEARMGVNSREWEIPEKKRRPLMRINVLQVMYNNGNKFMNDYMVAPIVLEEMTSPENMKRAFTRVRYSTYKRLMKELDLGIVKSLAFYENIPFSLLLELEKIKDDAVKAMLFAALKPGYGRYAGWEDLPEEELTPFQRMYLQYPMDYQRRVENVKYIVENTEDLENLTMDDLEYRDVEFGMVVVPVLDKRVRKILQEDYFKPIFERLQKEYNTEREKLLAQQEEDVTIPEKLRALENQYISRQGKLHAFADKFKALEVKIFALKEKWKNQDISRSAYEAQMQSFYDYYTKLVNDFVLSEFLTKEELERLEGILFKGQKTQVESSKEIPSETYQKKPSFWKSMWFQYGNYIVGTLFFALGVVFLWISFRYLNFRKRKK